MDSPILEKWLSDKRGGKVSISVPKRGQKSQMMKLARENARNVLIKDSEKLKREEKRTIGAMKELEGLLGIPDLVRMEAFDISNTNGFQNVASMVVFEKGKPKRSDYRKFRIRSVEGPDDYACMEEALSRRFSHGLREIAEMGSDPLGEMGSDPLGNKTGGFHRFPDLLMMDGGKGQVHIAEEVCKELGLAIPVCGMVKDDYHRTRGLYFHDRELPINPASEGFKLITRVQDEAHRFAIEYHRSLRGKAQTRSLLDEIEGIGPARRKALLRSFGSLEAIRDADEEQLSHAPSMNAASARKVYEFFHPASTK
jgi:excinuclease ABC subunit C